MQLHLESRENRLWMVTFPWVPNTFIPDVRPPHGVVVKNVHQKSAKWKWWQRKTGNNYFQFRWFEDESSLDHPRKVLCYGRCSNYLFWGFIPMCKGILCERCNENQCINSAITTQCCLHHTWAYGYSLGLVPETVEILWFRRGVGFWASHWIICCPTVFFLKKIIEILTAVTE